MKSPAAPLPQTASLAGHSDLWRPVRLSYPYRFFQFLQDFSRLPFCVTFQVWRLEENALIRRLELRCGVSAGMISYRYCSVRRPDNSGHCPTSRKILRCLSPHLMVDLLRPVFFEQVRCHPGLGVVGVCHGQKWYLGNFLKHLGFADFPMMRGFSSPPSMLVHATSVRRSLAFLPLLQFCPFAVKFFLGMNIYFSTFAPLHRNKP